MKSSHHLSKKNTHQSPVHRHSKHYNDDHKVDSPQKRNHLKRTKHNKLHHSDKISIYLSPIKRVNHNIKVKTDTSKHKEHSVKYKRKHKRRNLYLYHSKRHKNIPNQNNKPSQTYLPNNTMNPEGTVFFIVGGPGSGKGTQCQKIVNEFGLVHLSADNLVRKESKSKSKYSKLINKCITNGQTIPVHITVNLIKNEIQKHFKLGRNEFILDGFPRNYHDLHGWNKVMNDIVDVPFLLYLECDTNEMINRILQRQQIQISETRINDDIQSLKKRLSIFQSETMPIIIAFQKFNKCKTVKSMGSMDHIYQNIRKLFIDYGLNTNSSKQFNELITTFKETTNNMQSIYYHSNVNENNCVEIQEFKNNNQRQKYLNNVKDLVSWYNEHDNKKYNDNKFGAIIWKKVNGCGYQPHFCRVNRNEYENHNLSMNSIDKNKLANDQSSKYQYNDTPSCIIC